ncbi:MAG: peptidase domain-containing ABC transporter [Saprospiraceae bacterium]|nr:peptidase domain-containing ABC transporter [Saprospiraceae bacterium]
MPFPFTRQLDAMDCGPACLKMITDHHGQTYPLQYLRDLCGISRRGVSLAGISDAAEQIGFRTMAVKISYDSTEETPGLIDFPAPFIAHWNQNHFVVVYKINSSKVWIADPAHSKIRLTRAQFCASWCSDGDQGVALGLEPSPEYYQKNEFSEQHSGFGWGQLLAYLRPYRRLLLQFFVGILAGILFQVTFPFLTQSLIDTGVQHRNLHFVWLILIAQLILFASQTAIQFIQSWILLQIGKRVNVNLISDFLSKLMTLPLGYFDSKNVGDLTQRISDNYRVENFLTGSVLHIVFSLLTLLVFSGILMWYEVKIFLVFAFFSSLYLIWVLVFMKQRAKIDYLAFRQLAETQQNVFEIVQGMQEIKLQGSERKRRWKWINIQAKLFRIQSRSLALGQYQDFGALIFTRTKDIIISYMAAKAVIDGQITLGTLVAIQYIVGQLNAPFEQIISFLRSAQDARLSLDRMGEITQIKPEDDPSVLWIEDIPEDGDITLENVNYRYQGGDENVLNDVNITIPYGKVTAIVGQSGSGKTTLLKLLLGFDDATSGRILIGHTPLQAISKKKWRTLCGTVMQEGFIFSDTIANNIAESDEVLEFHKLDHALRVANISDFVYSLPLSYNTMIGSKGVGISQGQKQRLLIARAVYKNPTFIFFDEATNALDATNERIIMHNLDTFYKDKTVVVVAHRLSTVKNAEQIIVLDAGRVAEVGTHTSLIAKKGKYWELVQNQLDLE